MKQSCFDRSCLRAAPHAGAHRVSHLLLTSSQGPPHASSARLAASLGSVDAAPPPASQLDTARSQAEASSSEAGASSAESSGSTAAARAERAADPRVPPLKLAALLASGGSNGGGEAARQEPPQADSPATATDSPATGLPAAAVPPPAGAVQTAGAAGAALPTDRSASTYLTAQEEQQQILLQQAGLGDAEAPCPGAKPAGDPTQTSHKDAKQLPEAEKVGCWWAALCIATLLGLAWDGPAWLQSHHPRQGTFACLAGRAGGFLPRQPRACGAAGP